MIESPFIQYCEQMDQELMGTGLDSYRTRALNLWEQNPYYLTNALIDDFIYRAKFQMNVIMSVEGEQGQFKSLFSIFWAFKLGEIFGYQFNMAKNLYVIPEDLDNGLRNSMNRSTHLLDEQRRKNVGIGAQSTQFSLMDYEEQCRYTQKNIIYASPEVKDHAHYFIFRAYTHERVYNKVCDACKIQKDCLANKNKWETLCKTIPFHERIGYPKNMTFLLFTRRKFDNVMVMRGFVTVPMPTPETLKVYDTIKAENIRKLETQEEDSFQYIRNVIDSFVQGEENNLIIVKGELSHVVTRQGSQVIKIPRDTRKYAVINEKLMENYLYGFLKSRRKFTHYEIRLILAGAKAKLLKICAERNNQLTIEKEKIIEKNYIDQNT